MKQAMRWLLPAMLAIGVQHAAAQPAAYPTRPVTLIVPFPAGGSSDATARMVARRLSELLGVMFDRAPGR